MGNTPIDDPPRWPTYGLLTYRLTPVKHPALDKVGCRWIPRTRPPDPLDAMTVARPMENTP
jgi:hypothetical protein